MGFDYCLVQPGIATWLLLPFASIGWAFKSKTKGHQAWMPELKIFEKKHIAKNKKHRNWNHQVLNHPVFSDQELWPLRGPSASSPRYFFGQKPTLQTNQNHKSHFQETIQTTTQSTLQTTKDRYPNNYPSHQKPLDRDLKECHRRGPRCGSDLFGSLLQHGPGFWKRNWGKSFKNLF